MKHVVITGPTGVIGMALIKKCIDEGVFVTAVRHRGSKRIPRVLESDAKYIRVIECDLQEIKKLPDLLAEYKSAQEIDNAFAANDYQPDVFYHFAWACTYGESRNNIEAQVDNIKYTCDAIEVAAKLGCKRFVGAGSQAEYGRTDKVLCATTPCFPENAYGMAKLAAGQLGKIKASQVGIEFIWTRILSVYGLYDGPNTLTSSVLNKLINGEHIATTKGEQIWDFLYSEDAAKAMYLIGKCGIDGKTYVIGSGKAMPLKKYIDIIVDEVRNFKKLQACDSDDKSNRTFEPDINYGEIEYSEKQVMHLEADISELTNDTGYMPEIDFAKGIRKMLAEINGHIE